jgi:hypothetical protein
MSPSAMRHVARSSPPQPSQNPSHINTTTRAMTHIVTINQRQAWKMTQRFRNSKSSSLIDTQTTQLHWRYKSWHFYSRPNRNSKEADLPGNLAPPSDAACRAKPVAHGTLDALGTRMASDLLKRLRASTRICRRVRTHTWGREAHAVIHSHMGSGGTCCDNIYNIKSGQLVLEHGSPRRRRP